MRKRLSASIDYLLAILSPLDVAAAMRGYVEAQPVETLLAQVRRCIKRMEGAERWELAIAFGSQVRNAENPLFDRAGPSEAELLALAEAASGELHDRFIRFLQRNPRALTALDSEATYAIFSPLADGATSEDVPLDPIRLRLRRLAVAAAEPSWAARAAVLLFLIFIPSRLAHEGVVATRAPLPIPRVAAEHQVIPRPVARATSKPVLKEMHALTVAAVPAHATPKPSVHTVAAALDPQLVAEAPSSSTAPALPDQGAAPVLRIRRLGAAPADESFGRLDQTVLGIRNQLDAFDATSDSGMVSSSIATKLDDLQDAVLSWQQLYPHDPWLPRSLTRLIKDYARAGEASSPRATQALRIMRDAYPSSPQPQLTIAAAAPAPDESVDETTVLGEVVDASTGEPVKGAMVFVAPYRESNDSASTPFAATASDGSFSVQHVRPAHTEYVLVEPPSDSRYGSYHEIVDGSNGPVHTGIIRLAWSF